MGPSTDRDNILVKFDRFTSQLWVYGDRIPAASRQTPGDLTARTAGSPRNIGLRLLSEDSNGLRATTFRAGLARFAGGCVR
jgi:hypothetical protein